MEISVPFGDRSALPLPLGRRTAWRSEEAGELLRERPAGAIGSRQPRLLGLLERGRAERPFRAPVGVGPSGPLWITLDQPAGAHCIVVEGPGAARSDLLRTVAIGLALCSRPTLLQMVAIDLTGQELHPLETLPHAAGETASDRVAARMSLRWLAAEFQSRLAEGRAWPRMLLVVDDLGSVMAIGPRKTTETVDILFRQGADIGIHVLAGATPSSAGRIPSGARVLRLAAGATTGFYHCHELAEGEEFLAATVPIGDLDWVARRRFRERRTSSMGVRHPGAAGEPLRRRMG